MTFIFYIFLKYITLANTILVLEEEFTVLDFEASAWFDECYVKDQQGFDDPVCVKWGLDLNHRINELKKIVKANGFEEVAVRRDVPTESF